jgi:endogenous inhibitor of DNA gyrase (YacG/DUF329 family)
MTETTRKSRARSCPICGKPAVERYFPFCSPRCADVDLGRWLKGAYSIPVSEEEATDEGEPEGAPRERRE